MNQKSATSQIAVVHLSGLTHHPSASATNNGSSLKKTNSATNGNAAINYSGSSTTATAPLATAQTNNKQGNISNSNNRNGGVASATGSGPGIPPKPSMLGFRSATGEPPVKSVSIKVPSNQSSSKSASSGSDQTASSDKSTDSGSPVPPDARAKQVLKEAVNAVVNSFAKNSAQGGYGRGELNSPIKLIRVNKWTNARPAEEWSFWFCSGFGHKLGRPNTQLMNWNYLLATEELVAILIKVASIAD